MKRAIILGAMFILAGAVGAQTSLLDDYSNAQGLPGYPEVKALTPRPPQPDDLQVGRQLAEMYCISCHGINFTGEGLDESINLSPPQSLKDPRNYRFGYLDLAIFRDIKYGIPEVMDPQQEFMTDDQIWALTYYLRSLQSLPEGTKEHEW